MKMGLLLSGYGLGFMSIAPNVRWLCVRSGFPALKLNSSNNFKFKTNDK